MRKQFQTVLETFEFKKNQKNGVQPTLKHFYIDFKIVRVVSFLITKSMKQIIWNNVSKVFTANLKPA